MSSIENQTRSGLVLKPVDARVRWVSVMGISEWWLWYARPEVPFPQEETSVVDECIDDHLAADMDQIVWSCGRSNLDYWSELPNATRVGDVLGERLTASLVPPYPKMHLLATFVMKKLCPLRRAVHHCRE